MSSSTNYTEHISRLILFAPRMKFSVRKVFSAWENDLICFQQNLIVIIYQSLYFLWHVCHEHPHLFTLGERAQYTHNNNDVM